MLRCISSLLFLLVISGCSSSQSGIKSSTSHTGIESLDTQAPSLYTIGNVPPDAVPPSDTIGCEKQPIPIKQYLPDYPQELRLSGTGGEVWVKMWISKDGTVKQARVIKTSNEKLNKPAAEAAMRWLFNPGETNGKSVDTWVYVPFRWSLHQ